MLLKMRYIKSAIITFSALFKSFAPKLLDIDEETAPPRAPKAICCVSIIAGNANVIAAKGMMPSWPINQNSANTHKCIY